MNAKKMLLLIATVALLSTAPTVRTAETDDYLLYAGTYTGGDSKGIYAFRFQPSTGKTVSIGLAVESANPAFLAVHPDRRTLYAVNEALVSEGGNGSISAFAIDAKTGRLTFLNKMSSGGRNPCHLTIDRYGKWLLAANYSSGSVSVFPIKEDGRLGA
ncbi:MAG: hypothetical protein H6Q07_1140, partial [Acidobacteria bacterium]|nr:hypothetical protein [Acidobacteriota bacterium]